MKNIFTILIFVLFISGCGAKQYEDNKLFGKGLNAGVKYDSIKNDAYLISKIHEFYYDFFEYQLNYAEAKMKEILEGKKVFSVKKAKEQAEQEAKQYNIEGNITNDSIFNEIVKDYSYESQ